MALHCLSKCSEKEKKEKNPQMFRVCKGLNVIADQLKVKVSVFYYSACKHVYSDYLAKPDFFK